MMKIIYIILPAMLFLVSCGDTTLNNNETKPSITISFSIPFTSDVNIKIYPFHDANGESLDNIQINGGTYISPENLKFIFSFTGTYEAGVHSFSWNQKDFNGNDVLPGWYRVVISVNSSSFIAIKDIYVW